MSHRPSRRLQCIQSGFRPTRSARSECPRARTTPPPPRMPSRMPPRTTPPTQLIPPPPRMPSRMPPRTTPPTQLIPTPSRMPPRKTLPTPPPPRIPPAPPTPPTPQLPPLPPTPPCRQPLLLRPVPCRPSSGKHTYSARGKPLRPQSPADACRPGTLRRRPRPDERRSPTARDPCIRVRRYS